ncbi:hypothetical protein BX616_007331, partial [Lobosporangium transversale]
GLQGEATATAERIAEEQANSLVLYDLNEVLKELGPCLASFPEIPQGIGDTLQKEDRVDDTQRQWGFEQGALNN